MISGCNYPFIRKHSHLFVMVKAWSKTSLTILQLLLLAFATVSQNTVNANGQSEMDTNISNGIAQQCQHNIIETIEKRLVNARNELATTHRLLRQEQHVQISLLWEVQLRRGLNLMKQFLSNQTKVNGRQPFETRKLVSGKFCY